MTKEVLRWWQRQVPRDLTGEVIVRYQEGQVRTAEYRRVKRFDRGEPIDFDSVLETLDSNGHVPVEVKK